VLLAVPLLSLCVEILSVLPLPLLAPTQAASNAAANDDGDALLNRKRVGFSILLLFFLTDDWLNLQWRS
jgi:hypothetical protein